MAGNDIKKFREIHEIQQNYNIKDSLFVENEEKIDSVLENESNFGHFDGLDNSKQKERDAKVKSELEKRIRKITQDVKTAEKNNGVLRRGFSWFKNRKWIDKISNSTNDVLVAQSNELKSLNNEDISKVFLEITGFEYNDENIEKFLKNEILTKSEDALKKYKEGQENFSEFGSDMASTALATTAFTAAGAFIAALGAPVLLVGAGAVAVAATVGAGTKVASNALAASNANQKYDNIAKDALLGAINGALAPITAIGGGKIASKIVTSKLLGGTATKALAKGSQKVVAEGIEEVAERTSQKASTIMTDILNPYGYNFGGSNLVKAIGYTTQFTIDGSIGGAADAAVRTAYEGGSSEDIIQSAGQGALFGTIGSLGFGWGFKGLGSIAHNLGYNKGIEINGGRSVNDQALIDAGGNPTKRYHIPKPKDNSGVLYSGLPIMEIARFLGKNTDFKTLDDVANDYIIHRFYSMKRYAPDQFKDFMNGIDGMANTLDEIEISPQRFVEDVLFSEETLSPTDFFEFNKFRRKFNKEKLNETLSELLQMYELNNPDIHSANGIHNTNNDFVSGPVIRDEPAPPKANDTPTRSSDVNSDNPSTTSSNESSRTELVDLSKEKAIRKAALKGIKAKQGVQTQTEYFIREEITDAFKANDMNMRQDLIDIFNLYCGANRDACKNIAEAFEVEYKAAKGDSNKLKQVIQKFKNLTDEQKLEITKHANDISDTPPVRATEGSNNDGKNLDITDTEGLQGSRGNETGEVPHGSSDIPDFTRLSDEQIRIIYGSMADDIFKIRKVVPDFNPSNYPPDILVTLIKYNENKANIVNISDVIKLYDNLKDTIDGYRIFDENGTIFELINPNVYKKTIDNFIDGTGDLVRLKKYVNTLFSISSNNELKELRKFFADYDISRIDLTFKKNSPSSDNNAVHTIKILLKNRIDAKLKTDLIREISQNVDGYPKIITQVDSPKNIKHTEVGDVTPPKTDTPSETGDVTPPKTDADLSSTLTDAQIKSKYKEFADDIIAIRKVVSDFNPDKYEPKILENFIKYSKNKTNVISISDLIKLYDIVKSTNSIPEHKLFDENGTIIELIYPKSHGAIVKKIITGKEYKSNKNYIEQIFNITNTDNLADLRKLYADNNILQIKLINKIVKNSLDQDEEILKKIKIEFKSRLEASKKIKLIRDLSEISFPDVNSAPDVETKIRTDFILKELQKKQAWNSERKAIVTSYPKLCNFLGLTTKIIDEATEPKNLELEILKRMQNLAYYLSQEKFEIFTDTHTRMRFIERIVLETDSAIKTIDELIKKADECFENVIKDFESTDLEFQEYVNSAIYDDIGLSTEFNDRNGNIVHLGIDLNGKIRTIYYNNKDKYREQYKRKLDSSNIKKGK